MLLTPLPLLVLSMALFVDFWWASGGWSRMHILEKQVLWVCPGLSLHLVTAECMVLIHSLFACMTVTEILSLGGYMRVQTVAL